MRGRITTSVLGLMAVLAAPALAAEAPAARDLQAAVDSYVATADGDASLVGGPGSAGYDAGFWIRGGDFSLRINATLQARYEWWDWSEDANEFQPGGDLSGFSLPRATVKLSGAAPCNTRWYLELEFGHPGYEWYRPTDAFALTSGVVAVIEHLGPGGQSYNFAQGREAWIEWGCSAALSLRMGQIELPATRQLLTDPALQQFVDISFASAFLGSLLPGYTDRNREHGAMLHGAFGCEEEFSWMFAVTNGDSGDSIRNIWDFRTDDNLAFSGRLNWAFAKPTGYEEGALRQTTCDWYGEVGAWGFYHADRLDKPHPGFNATDWTIVGGDLQLGRGGLSVTAAFSWADVASDLGGDATLWTALAQVGFLFPDTAWEVAARWSAVSLEPDGGDAILTHEFAAAVNYYLNGHGNKLTLDVSWLMADADASLKFLDLYTGYHPVFDDETGLLVRFQWQLAL